MRLKSPYSRRRQQLFASMGQDAMAIIPARAPVMRNNDTEYCYRQDSDFYYLTGLEESDALLVLYQKAGALSFTLFCKSRDPSLEIWAGPLLGLEGAKTVLGADEVFDIAEVDKVIPSLLNGVEKLYVPLGADPAFDEKVLGWRNEVLKCQREGWQAPSTLLDVRALLHEARLFKDSEEIDLLKKAATISASAHVRMMQACRPGMMEYELEAECLHEFTRKGCKAPAYPSIVAGGSNACILHYCQNNQALQAGDLVLVDAGGEYQNYAADITRTFPVSGKFSKTQQAIYELVLVAQMAAIEMVRPGVSWDSMQQAVLEIMVPGLKDLGILKGGVDELIEKGAYKKFYMHHSGHWLGLDVHDVGQYKQNNQWRALQPGMVFTVEPGLYLPKDCLEIEEKWRGIGVRIEDEILVTETGYEVLSRDAPKTVSEIEETM